MTPHVYVESDLHEHETLQDYRRRVRPAAARRATDALVITALCVITLWTPVLIAYAHGR